MLRDASLTPDEAAPAARAIAGQLLGLGLQAVRVYVNGIESRHGQSVSSSGSAESERPARTDVHPRKGPTTASEPT